MKKLCAILALCAAAAIAWAQDNPPATHPAATQTSARASVIVVVGAEGEPEFGEVFIKSADRWAAAAKRAGANLTVIGRDVSPADGPTEKEQFQKALQAQAREGSQQLWLVFIGHGTSDGHEAKVNLRGPDFSDVELAQWLKPFTRPLAVIDCTSSSAPFLTRLSGRGRVVITATRSGAEVNYARFGEYMAAAIADESADLDKDGQVSILEAFLAASRGVDDFYKREGRLATEHALLDDNGDGMGIQADWFQGVRPSRAAVNGAPLDGPRAHQWHLIMSPAELALSPDVRAKRDELELHIESLRNRKSLMSEADYYAQLDSLLIDLAHVYQSPATQSK